MDRRRFLKSSTRLAGGLAALPLLPRMFASSALAQASPSGYKAIVCLNLLGGNDSNNTLIPTDQHYQEYSTSRGPLALAQKSLLPLKGATSGERQFGTHPALVNVAALYNSGHAAFVANTGSLNTSLTSVSIAQGAERPYNLLDHATQIEEWQAGVTLSISATGWAGRMADLLHSTQYYASLPTIVSTAGWSLFGQGRNTNSTAVNVNGPSAAILSPIQALYPVLTSLEQGDPLNHLHDVLSSLETGLINQSSGVNATVQAGIGIKTPFPNTSIGQQLLTIAQMINGRTAAETSRQVFFCQDANGYDTHTSQVGTHASNLACIDAAIGAFVNAMMEIGMFDQVTLFTSSDFGRSMQANSSGGSDHGWGGHQFVIGGAVKGGQIYGTYPSLILGGADDAGGTGIWIPTTADSQYAAILSNWMDVGAANTAAIFPELGNFKSKNLGFV